MKQKSNDGNQTQWCGNAIYSNMELTIDHDAMEWTMEELSVNITVAAVLHL